MLKYKFNNLIGYFEISPLWLDEGIEFAEREKYPRIRIRTLSADDYNKGRITLDLSYLENKTFITDLALVESNVFKSATGIEALYSLNNLKNFSCDLKLSLDFKYMPLIKYLIIRYHSKIKNLNALEVIEDLFLRSFNEDNCKVIERLDTLKKLRLLGSYNTLDGVDYLSNLHSLKLLYSKKIHNAEAINKLTGLRVLHIEKCSNLNDYSFLSENSSIENLFISELDSLVFVPQMNKLKSIKFSNVKDGNLTPLLNSHSLKEVRFYPNRKHYNYKLEQIHCHLQKIT